MAKINLRLLALLLVGVHESAASTGQVHPGGSFTDNAKYACSQIYTSLGTEIVQYAGAEYNSAASAAWNLINALEKPTCIVFPRKASHVQVAMKAIYTHEARYAVQAGGDSSPEGWNNVNAGVLIFFSNMTDLFYDEKKDTITLQPGLRWGDVVTALEPQGVAPVGSRQTGVGMGLFLGGGVGFLSPQHGFAADTFKEIDIVLTNGDLITATSSNKHKDLFRALKGGLNRFGIVTRYEVQAIHTGRKEDKTWYGGTIRYPVSSAEALLKAVARFVQTNKDPKAVLFASMAHFGASRTVGTAQIFYNGPDLPRDIFGEILAIPATSTALGPRSYFNVSNTLPRDNDPGNVQHFGGSALVGDEDLFLSAYSHWLNYSQTFSSNINLTVFGLTPVPQSQIDIGYQNGGNAISPPAGPYTIILFKTTFLPNVTSIPPDASAGIQLLLEKVPRSPGKPLFIGECDASQNVFASYGDRKFLEQTYQKYDPTHFNLRYTDGPSGLFENF